MNATDSLKCGSSTTRILIAELDSPAQRARFDSRGSRQAIVELTGMLRAAMLISRTVLVTDAMLLDGSYFVTLGPEGVLREMGANLTGYPLVVTGKFDSLREGLRSRLDNPGFHWSVKGIEFGQPVPENVRRSWQRWLSYIDDGIIDYEVQSDMEKKLDLSETPLGLILDPVLIRDLRAEPRRSLAWKRIDRAALSSLDRERAKSWWNGGYLRLIAKNAEADWVSFEAGSTRDFPLQDHQIQLPKRLLEWTRESTPATIAFAWDSTSAQRDRLHGDPGWAQLRDLAYAVTQVTRTASRRRALLDAISKTGIALLVIALALPSWEQTALENPLTWVVFAGGVLATIPFGALKSLQELSKRDEATALLIHKTKEK